MALLRPPVGPRDHTLGAVEAPVTLVEYGDFECPFCGRAYPELKQVLRQLGGKVQFVFRHFPLSAEHPRAQHAAEVAEAAAAQGKFWEMHDLLYQRQAALADEDLVRYARELGLDAERVRREPGAEGPEDLADLLSAVERFEAAVEAHGGDLMVDDLKSAEPDDRHFVVPRRAHGEAVRKYIGRIDEATAQLRRHPRQRD